MEGRRTNVVMKVNAYRNNDKHGAQYAADSADQVQLLMLFRRLCLTRRAFLIIYAVLMNRLLLLLFLFRNVIGITDDRQSDLNGCLNQFAEILKNESETFKMFSFRILMYFLGDDYNPGTQLFKVIKRKSPN